MSFAYIIDFTLPGSSWVSAYFNYGGTVAMNDANNLVLDEATREVIVSDTSLMKFKFVKR